ncbi:MAG: hypothetical protein MUF54_13660, partial [Polyangiaceae bacterium]|nr:hypothetical protein [Polyangiaceae bacterium]
MRNVLLSIPSSVRLGLVVGSGVLLGCVGYDESEEDSPASVAQAVTNITVMGTTTDKDQGGNLEIAVPSQAASGDVLLLFLHRTDGANIWNTSTLSSRMTPYRGWNGPLASCAVDNGRGDFNCAGTEADLNQVVFWRAATSSDLGNTLRINMPASSPAWAIMIAIRGASTSNPLRNKAAQTACDKVKQTRFPSVSGGQTGDLLLLSQSFDDGSSSGVNSSSFTAPSGRARFAYVIDKDEAGHLFGGT